MKKEILALALLLSGVELSCGVDATCADGLQNQDETAADCGGVCGATCTPGAACLVSGDCESSVCLAGVCEAPRCGDQVRNGMETDTDCGGPCSPCPDYASCVSATDCRSGLCTMNTCYVGAFNSLTPTSGARSGGTAVTITGAGFQDKPPTEVRFGGVSGTGLSILSNTELVVTAPAKDSVGVVDVALVYADGTLANRRSAFRYYYGQVEFEPLPHVFPLVKDKCNDLAAVDLNADGKDDLVVVCDDHVESRFSNGDGTFAPAISTDLYAPTTPPAYRPIGQVAVADFNRDKKADLAITLRGAKQLAILTGKGDGTFSVERIAPPGLKEPIPLKVADFDNDEYPDIVYAGQSSPPQVCFLRREAQDKAKWRAAECYSFLGGLPTNLSIADFDRNGGTDVVVSSYTYPGYVVVLYNSLNGIFTKFTGLNTSCATGNIFAGDWDGDGQPDLIASTENRDCYKLIYFSADGKGGFQGEKLLEVLPQHQAYEAASADFDANGTPDIVMEGDQSKFATVLLSQRGPAPSGALRLPYLDVAPDQCYGVVAGDFDGDKRIDIALSCAVTGWLNLFMNRAQ